MVGSYTYHDPPFTYLVRLRLFRPFQTTKPDGVGLGLYSARQIVGLHRGTIGVRSAPGAGTTVRIALPAADESR